MNFELSKVQGSSDESKKLERTIQELNSKLAKREEDLKTLERNTQTKVAELMKNYEAEIKILKNERENQNSKSATLINREA